MRELILKDATIFISADDETYVGNILEIINKADFKEITKEEYETALWVEKLTRGETIDLGNGHRMRFKEK